MTLFGYRVPMMASLIVWGVLWEIVGRSGVVFILPPLSDVLAAAVELVHTPSWQSATVTTLRAFVFASPRPTRAAVIVSNGPRQRSRPSASL